MSNFTNADFKKHDYKYSLALLQKIECGEIIHIEQKVNGITVISEATIQIDNYVKAFKEAIYDKALIPPTGNFIDTNGNKYTFTKIHKQDFSNVRSKSRNSYGRELANSGELATILSLTKDINTPEDTNQKIFMDNPDLFLDWKDTFDNTKKLVQRVVGTISQYSIIHDATDTTGFASIIAKTAQKIGITKDAYNPADVYLVKKSKLNEVKQELNAILNEQDTNVLIHRMNQKIYNLYKEGLLYPISLKQLKGTGKIEYSNEPGQVLPDYEINGIHCNMSWTKGKEIGVITFKTVDGNSITTQIRGFPHSYGISQMEITSDGSRSGGRLGKVPTNILDRTTMPYNGWSRVKSISYFGAKKIENGKQHFLTNCDDKKVESWYKTYSALKTGLEGTHESISLKDFKTLINGARCDEDLAANIAMKVQGLLFLEFFAKNIKYINSIVSKIVYGAKKMSTDNAFFIKIY